VGLLSFVARSPVEEITMPDMTPPEPADTVTLPEQAPMDDDAGGPTVPSADVPTEDKPEDAESSAHPS
jgi:hypothetical protein